MFFIFFSFVPSAKPRKAFAAPSMLFHSSRFSPTWQMRPDWLQNLIKLSLPAFLIRKAVDVCRLCCFRFWKPKLEYIRVYVAESLAKCIKKGPNSPFWETPTIFIHFPLHFFHPASLRPESSSSLPSALLPQSKKISIEPPTGGAQDPIIPSGPIPPNLGTLIFFGIWSSKELLGFSVTFFRCISWCSNWRHFVENLEFKHTPDKTSPQKKTCHSK